MRKESGVVIVPAAQYLRMSTEHQKYSLPNQVTTNQSFAELNGFHIVKDYVDSGKSGLDLRHRDALKQLISDVLGGKQEYKVVLVYDISRWGRFQDNDEPAYYEFLCRSAGVQVHYCAELFKNDGTLASAVMKALRERWRRNTAANWESRSMTLRHAVLNSDSNKGESPDMAYGECSSLPIERTSSHWPRESGNLWLRIESS